MKIRILTTVSLIALSTAAFAQSAPTNTPPAGGFGGNQGGQERMQRFEEHRAEQQAKLDEWAKRLEERKVRIHEMEERLAKEKMEISEREKELAEARLKFQENGQKFEEHKAEMMQHHEERMADRRGPAGTVPTTAPVSAPSTTVTH